MIKRICKDIKKCTGCGACAQICPANSIKMAYTPAGFLEPIIDESCIECFRCQKVCPVNTPVDLYPMQDAWLANSLDKNILLQNSSSGGLGYELARTTVDNGGVAFGAAFAEGCKTVYHKMVTETNQIVSLCGSKYIQSETLQTFVEVKRLLKTKSLVLYVGTPCQIAGLRNYLGSDNVENLFTVDFMCHGVISTKIFNDYIDTLGLERPIKELNFRKKTTGYNLDCGLFVKDTNGKEFLTEWLTSSLGLAFVGNIINRESCSTCTYATSNRVSDITLADCVSLELTEEERHNGASLVVVNSKKGKVLLKSAADHISIREIEIKRINTLLHFVAPTHPHKNKKAVFRALGKMDYELLSSKYFTEYKAKISVYYILRRIKRKLGRMLHRMLKKGEKV